MPAGSCGGSSKLVEGLAARDLAGQVSRQEVQRILHLSDVALHAGDAHRGEIEELLRLLDVEAGWRRRDRGAG